MGRTTLLQRTAVVLLLVVVAVTGVVLLRSGGPDHSRADQPSARATASASSTGKPDSVAAADLPPEARATLRRIRAGGPFPYERDGVVFENRESLLPTEPRGYYHEYTVSTPGSSDRGARRIISASGGFFYYTADHYRTFRQVLGS